MSKGLGAVLGVVMPVVIAGGVGVVLAVPQAREAFIRFTQQSGQLAAEAQLDADEKQDEQLDAYVYCTNNVNHRARESMERYATWVDVKQGPTGSERRVYGLYEVDKSVLGICRERLQTAARVGTNEDLKKLAAEYATKLDAFMPQLAAAAYYYEQKKYADDGFAEGKKLHGPLVAGYREFIAAANALEAELEKVNDARAVETLARIEKEEGKKLAYWQRKTMLDAKATLRAAEAEKVDVANLGKLLDVLEQDAKEVAAQPASERPPMWGMFEGRPEAYLKAARAYWRRQRDQVPFEASEVQLIEAGQGESIEGTFDHLLEAYNRLVDGSNAL